MAREEGEIISASEIVFAFGRRGSCATVTRKGRSVDGAVGHRVARSGRASSCNDLLRRDCGEKFAEVFLQIGNGICGHSNGRKMPQLRDQYRDFDLPG